MRLRRCRSAQSHTTEEGVDDETLSRERAKRTVLAVAMVVASLVGSAAPATV
jgi:hypothetical protein